MKLNLLYLIEKIALIKIALIEKTKRFYKMK